MYFRAHHVARFRFERSCLGAAASSTREGKISSISSVYLLRDFCLLEHVQVACTAPQRPFSRRMVCVLNLPHDLSLRIIRCWRHVRHRTAQMQLYCWPEHILVLECSQLQSCRWVVTDTHPAARPVSPEICCATPMFILVDAVWGTGPWPLVLCIQDWLLWLLSFSLVTLPSFSGVLPCFTRFSVMAFTGAALECWGPRCDV